MAWNKLPKNFHGTKQKSGMDRFDLEAEAEAHARRWVRENEVAPTVLGRRISKETRKHNGAEVTADCRAAKNFVKDHRAAVARVTIKQHQLEICR